jgi:hypothetical protein
MLADAAMLGVAVTDRWELPFDTVTQSRKHQNLVKNPRVAFVIGGSTSAPCNTKALPIVATSLVSRQVMEADARPSSSEIRLAAETKMGK